MAKKKRKINWKDDWEEWEDKVGFVDKLSPLKKGEKPLTSKELEARGFKGETEEEYEERKRKEERRKATESRKESEKSSPFRETEQPPDPDASGSPRLLQKTRGKPERDFSRRAGLRKRSEDASPFRKIEQPEPDRTRMRKSSERDSPFREVEQPDRPNIFQKAGRKLKGAVVGAAKGVAGMFEEEEADSTPPTWIEDPDVGVSDPNLDPVRAMAQSRGRAKEEGLGGGKGEYWTDPADGTTYFKPSRENELVEREKDGPVSTRPISSARFKPRAKPSAGPRYTPPEPATRREGPSYTPPEPKTRREGPSYTPPESLKKTDSKKKSQRERLRELIEKDNPKKSEQEISEIMDAIPEGSYSITEELEPERFEGTPPRDVDVDDSLYSVLNEQLEFDLEDPTIIDALTSPKSPSPVDDPEPVELPFKAKADKRTDTEKVKDSPVVSDMVIKTQEALGTDWKSPTGQIVVTSAALEEEASTEPEPPYRLTIDPNVNIATVFDSQGMEVRQFAVGTGDTTGTRYGKKYFTPTGTAEIINKVPYEQVEGSYGPIWMGLDWKSYGLHGPHAAADIKATGTGFENQGFVSHGCIRFMEKDLMDLSEYLNVGSSVEVLPYRTRPLHRGPLRVGAK